MSRPCGLAYPSQEPNHSLLQLFVVSIPTIMSGGMKPMLKGNRAGGTANELVHTAELK